MKPTETCLSRMEHGFDSRRRYKTENQTFTRKSRCLISVFLYVRAAYSYPFYTAFYRFWPLPLLQICCKFLQCLLQHSVGFACYYSTTYTTSL